MTNVMYENDEKIKIDAQSPFYNLAGQAETFWIRIKGKYDK